MIDRMISRRRRSREPIERWFLLCDCCMPLLTPNAWKVLSYIAREEAREFVREWQASNDPSSLLRKDIARVCPSLPSADEPPTAGQLNEVDVDYSSFFSSGSPSQTSGVPARWRVRVPIDEICSGSRLANQKFRDWGTGLSEHEVVEAIDEAVRYDFLERRGDSYSLNWHTIFDLERRLKTKRSKPRFS
jgi:hypothetical protein